MATPGGTPNIAGSFPAAPHREILEISSDSNSDSENSIVEPEPPNAGSGACRWRTAEFNDQECSRFFDCPSHTVERALSEHEAEPHEVSLPDEYDEYDEHGQVGQARTRMDTGMTQASSSTSIFPSSAEEEQFDADAQENHAGDHSGAAIDLTLSPGPEDRDVAMRSPPDDDEQDVESEDVLHQHIRHPAMASGVTLTTEQALSPPREVIDLTRNETPSPTPLPPTPPQANPAPLPPSQRQHRPSLAGLVGARPFLERAAYPSEVSLPRWQPDAEATLCPICRTQFSFFVRKHHCRKCGRVVCNACSPHRITIPYQYIVQPPEQPRLSSQRYPPSYVGGDGSYGDFSNIGGGERVRLCNPCVPDPNVTPPQPQQSPNPTSPRSHGRSQSNVSVGFGGGPPPPGRLSAYITSGLSQGPDSLGRHRSVTHSGPGYGPTASARTMHAPMYNSTHSRILTGTPPSYFPATASVYPGASARGFQSMLDVDTASSSSRERALPPPPPQLDEEDECPVCHRELPSRTLPNFEAVRESHITTCIITHSAYVSGGTPTQGSGGNASTPGAASPFAMRLTGIFPYVATEKDCVDSAECTICLEEFEEGVQMARLECLCRFHMSCIRQWFKKHPGRCPVHQHDSFGY